jgi:phytoene dehydrogenase-like protein
MEYDAIIIGTGIGGLIAGAKIVKEGKKVLFIEQESTPGGYASCLNISDDYVIDFGLHSMEGLYEDDPKLEVFKDLEIFPNVEFETITTGLYKFYNERKEFTLPDSEEKIIEKLIEWFPDEKKSITNFFKTITTKSISKWEGKTAGELLDDLLKNDELKLVLVGNIQYYCDDPYKLSAIVYANALTSRFKAGSHYIKGGSIKFSYGLVNFIKERGGTFLFDRVVTRIKDEKGKAVGVEYITKGGREKKVHDINAKIIIANAPIPHVANELLQGKSHKKLKELINNLEVGHSLLNIYLGFSKPPIDLGNNSYTTIINDPSVVNLQQVADNHRGEYEKRNFLFIDYSQINSMLVPFGRSMGVISTVDYIENWGGFSKAEYSTKKKEVAQIFIDRLNKLFPDIVKHIEYYYVSTPKTKADYTLNPNGTFLGFANTVEQSGDRRLKNKSPIKNLYFASAWTYPGGGFSSTIQSGWQCAKEVLKKL